MIEMRRSSLAGLLSAGTAAYPAPVRQRLIIVNVLALLIFVASLNYALVYALTDFATYRLFVVFNLVLCALALLVPLGHRVNEIAGGLMVAGFEFVGLFVLTALLGRNSGIQLNYIIGAAVPFLCFGLNRIGLILAVGKLKRFKRVALRCEKTSRNFASIIAIAAGFGLLKSVHTA